ncbi:hypothetical protein CH293_01285 [Rhodococcus sp. 14-2470-1b]|jgi:DNA-binding CsgD family transcriptional regulator|uniref:helix-turn-helix transcriptional regulator n=1 Tax=Rhodococcus sp. 14-2470-1b TaxID=2023149 RepID=UPI000B9B4C4F|nr:hypothetical protein CH293_01285 [Rhodococcus sp. 14-2470-1b]
MTVSRRRTGDLGAMTFSLFIAAMVVFDGVTAADFSDLRVATAIAIGAVATALLWWRQRRPVGIALVLAALTVFSDAAGGAELVAIYTVASVLTDREREVAIAVAQGLSNAEISGTLFMSVATVKTYVSRVLAKLGCTNRVQIAIAVFESR